MEQLLDAYHADYNTEYPLVCMDEAAKQIVADVSPALPMTPGQPRREDHHYERKGVRALFMFFDPLRGWRRVSTRKSRMRSDWAEEIQQLLDVDYPKARCVTLVCDNLNTHHFGSLYYRFNAATAGRLRHRLQLVHTPRNGSWLNMAEIELSVLTRQCIGRRFQSVAAMEREIGLWEADRNAARLGADWRMTTNDARIKLKRLYPNT